MVPHSYGGNAINDGTNYVSGFEPSARGLPAVTIGTVPRSGRWPALAGIGRPGRKLALRIIIRNESNLAALRLQVLQWFDPEEETSQQLVIRDVGGGNERYVMAICEELLDEPGSGGSVFLARMVVDGDVRWRSVEVVEDDPWEISGHSDTEVVANGGEDDAYPVFTITPTAPKAGYNIYKRWVSLVWRGDAGTPYPVELTDGGLDTAALVTASKMQADGDDIRVVVDGVEVDYWLEAMNTAATKIWANVDFAYGDFSALLEADIDDLDTVTSIDSTADVSQFPSSGILLINDEAFVYTGKSDSLRRFTGVTRAAKGTAAADHTAGDSIFWVQHDVWITYGNGSAAAYPSDDDLKPMFALASSSNTSWNYDEFGSGSKTRPASWAFVNVNNVNRYTANQNTDADPWQELGLRSNDSEHSGRWQLYNPCGITNANFQNGHKWVAGLLVGLWRAYIASSARSLVWITEHTIADPSAASTWEAWSQNEALNSGSKYIALWLESESAFGPSDCKVEVADVTLTLDSSVTPDITLGAEQGNYPLAAILRNNATGDELLINFTMEEDESLEIDTDAKTVTYLADGSNAFGAVEVVGAVRNAWLKLAPGNNTLEFIDEGTVGLTIDIAWEERFYG